MLICLSLDSGLLQNITTIATVIIACVALFLSVWQFLALRAHNRLSVKPILSYEIYKANTENGYGIYIRNNGIGPAIIKDFIIFVDDEEIIADRKLIWKIAASKTNIDYKFIKFFTLYNDYAIPTGIRFPILTIDKEFNTQQSDMFKSALKRLNIKIKYESIYNEKFTANLND